MIPIDFSSAVYVCPYCGTQQAFENSFSTQDVLYGDQSIEDKEKRFILFSIRCSNGRCRKITVIARNRSDGHQVDIAPQHVFRQFPDYIPAPIRADYEEASQILDLSPKAAATLLRRCLQGMIRDFWGISKSRLIDEVMELKNHVPAAQWKAIDGLRQLGNIGAHMEKDVNLIIDIEKEDALGLLQLIELLMIQWYVNRHEQELLYNTITNTAATKAAEKNP